MIEKRASDFDRRRGGDRRQATQPRAGQVFKLPSGRFVIIISFKHTGSTAMCAYCDSIGGKLPGRYDEVSLTIDFLVFRCERAP